MSSMLSKLLVLSSIKLITPNVCISAGCIAGGSSHLRPSWLLDPMSTSKLNLPYLWTVFTAAEHCGTAHKALT